MSADTGEIIGGGEFAFISGVAAKAELFEGVITGIGDDASVHSATDGMQILASTDLLLENVHFRRSWHDLFLLGRKCLAVNLSDIAAMGGIPRWALLSLGIPADMEIASVELLVSGFTSCASEHRVSLTGGDTCRSRSGLTVSVTIIGEQLPDLVVRRSGASAGDDIWVTGTLGDAALALSIIETGDEAPQDILFRLLNPSPRVAAGLALAEAGLVTAMIDISDGLLADFGHIAKLSGVGADIFVADLPLSESFLKLSRHYDLNPVELALAGGEDYELCFTANSSVRDKIADCMKKCGAKATRVGIVNSLNAVRGINPGGTVINCFGGYDHFR